MWLEVDVWTQSMTSQCVDMASQEVSIRRSLLQKPERICDGFAQFYAKDIIHEDKQELDDALHREYQPAFRIDENRRTPPTSQDEMRAGMSYFMKQSGRFSSWMGGDHDGNKIFMWCCIDEIPLRAEELYRPTRSDVGHYIVLEIGSSN
ncbi:phosphoenolpyruvate carboxylase [Tanacetum coccineum]